MKRKSVQERFYSKVTVAPNGCHEWTGCLAKNGYGMFHKGGKTTYTHRVAWEIEKGEIPEGLYILHKCDNRKCVNVEHMRLGTFDDNMADMVSKNRQAWGSRSGHAKLSEEDVAFIRSSTEKQADLAERYGMTQGNISTIRSGKSWKFIAEDIV